MNSSNVKFAGMLSLALSVAAVAGQGAEKAKEAAPVKKVYPTIGSVERLDAALDALIPPDAQLEKLVGGLEWAEGPVWVPKSKSLLFSDVPRNVIFQWREGVGTRDFLYPSGYTGSIVRGGALGSNGLALDEHGRLVLCQHGDRRIARLNPDGSFTTLARLWKYRRFNSPNDLVFDAQGNLYFTDPPYGLEKGNDDPAKELVFSGLFLLRPNGEVVLLTDKLSYPNGVDLSPDEKTLYVSVSDPKAPRIMAYDLKEDGTLGEGRVFFDAAPLSKTRKGLTDGFKVDAQGNLFASGPGGLLVLSPEGQHLGTLQIGELVSNCAWGEDGSTLYITADMYLCRIQTSTIGRTFAKGKKKRRK
jgi:gluconolactonase